MAAGMMMLGMGGLQMLSGMEANAQQRAMEQAQHAIRLSNFNREKMVGSLQNMMKNIEISRINQARWRQNREIARAANMNRVLQEGELRRSVGGKLMQISRGQSQALDTLTSKVAGSGMTPESGTARALRKMIQNASGQEMQNLKRNDYVSRQNIIREQDKALASRDLHGYKQGSTYFSGPAPQLVQTAKTSPLQAATMFAGGAAQGLSMAGDLNALNPDQKGFQWGDLW